jgi:hypothetical protein
LGCRRAPTPNWGDFDHFVFERYPRLVFILYRASLLGSLALFSFYFSFSTMIRQHPKLACIIFVLRATNRALGWAGCLLIVFLFSMALFYLHLLVHAHAGYLWVKRLGGLRQRVHWPMSPFHSVFGTRATAAQREQRDDTRTCGTGTNTAALEMIAITHFSPLQ